MKHLFSEILYNHEKNEMSRYQVLLSFLFAPKKRWINMFNILQLIGENAYTHSLVNIPRNKILT